MDLPSATTMAHGSEYSPATNRPTAPRSARPFWIGFGGGALVGLIFPVVLLSSSNMPLSDTVRWLQNTPAYSVFLLSAFPVMTGLLSEVLAAVAPEIRTFRHRAEVALFALVTFGLTLAVIADAFPRDRLAPFMLRGKLGQEAVTLESRLRADVNRSTLRPVTEHRADSVRYRAIVGSGYGSLGRLRSQASTIGWAMLFVTLITTLVVPAMITMGYLLVRFSRIGRVVHIDILLLNFVLASTFVAFREYTVWYRDLLYDSSVLDDVVKFIVLAVFAFAIVGAIILKRRATRAKLLFGALFTIGSTASAIIGQKTWGWLSVISSAPLVQILALYVLFLTAILFYSLSIRAGAIERLPNEG